MSQRVFVIDGKKRCSKCREWKLTAEFNADPKALSGYRCQCKQCHRLTLPKQNPERAARWYRRRCQEPGFRELHRERTRRSSQTDQGKKRRNERRRLYFERFPEKRAEYNKNSYGRRRGSGGKVTASQWAFIKAVFGGLCAYCRECPGDTMDHFVPVVTGGKHGISNVVPACRSCNSSKHHRDPFEWMESKNVDSDLVVALICETRFAA